MDYYFYEKLKPYIHIWNIFKKDRYIPTGCDAAINTINDIYNERFNSNNVLKSGCNQCILTAFRVFHGYEDFEAELKATPPPKPKRPRL